jgi:DNA polymerase-4
MLYQRRMRLRLLVFVLADWFAERTKSIFEDTEEMLSLYQAMDRMKNATVLM